MRRSTRLRLAVCPSARKAAWILGAPYRPRCVGWTRRISVSGRDWPSYAGFRAGHASIIPRRRDAHHIAHDANREPLALIFDEAEFHLGASEKMRSVFFRISRSM